MNDDPAESGVLAQGLSAEGWSVHLAPNRHDAMNALEATSFEALVVDLQMPDEAGLSVAAHGLVMNQSPVVIGVTEKSDETMLARAARAGAHDVLEKPISAAQVEERVGFLLRRRTSMPAVPADPADSVLGETPTMRAVRDQIRGLSHFPDLPVLIVGESGSGKRLVARAVHEATAPASAMTHVPCAAIPESAFEAELFGREVERSAEGGRRDHNDGSNGARKTRVGSLEAAGNGTLYLDEIAELPAALIPKLLKVLETRTFRRVGGDRDLPFQARVIGATSRQAAPDADGPAAELHRRLSGFTVALPPLRERRADVERLARHFLEDYCARRGSPARQLSSWACDVLREREWPGNVRELRAAVRQAAEGPGAHLGFAEISAVLPEGERAPHFSTAPPNGEAARMEPLRELEHRLIREAWELSSRNLTAAARALGLPRTTLRDRLKRYGLR